MIYDIDFWSVKVFRKCHRKEAVISATRTAESAKPYRYDTVFWMRNSVNRLNQFLQGDSSRLNGQLTEISVRAIEKLKDALTRETMVKALAQWIQEQEKSGTTVDAAIKALSTVSQQEVFA